jgi:hypothetical protein
VELFDADKPATVQNFIRYIQAGRYQDSIMHRAVTNFVIQGGGIYVTNRGTTNAALIYIPPMRRSRMNSVARSTATFTDNAMAKTATPTPRRRNFSSTWPTTRPAGQHQQERRLHRLAASPHKRLNRLNPARPTPPLTSSTLVGDWNACAQARHHRNRDLQRRHLRDITLPACK